MSLTLDECIGHCDPCEMGDMAKCLYTLQYQYGIGSELEWKKTQSWISPQAR
jgi:hypothetical protein